MKASVSLTIDSLLTSPGQILMATKYLHWEFSGKSESGAEEEEGIIRKLLLNIESSSTKRRYLAERGQTHTASR